MIFDLEMLAIMDVLYRAFIILSMASILSLLILIFYVWKK